jgi:hypothetical protein
MKSCMFLFASFASGGSWPTVPVPVLEPPSQPMWPKTNRVVTESTQARRVHVDSARLCIEIDSDLIRIDLAERLSQQKMLNWTLNDASVGCKQIPRILSVLTVRQRLPEKPLGFRQGDAYSIS